MREITADSLKVDINGWFAFAFEPQDDKLRHNTELNSFSVFQRHDINFSKLTSYYDSRARDFLRSDVYQWLLDNVGDELFTYWPEDRLKYVDPRSMEQSYLPSLERNWRETSTPIPHSRINWSWQPRFGMLAFRTKEQAVMFKLAWA